jgi:hypothetical protein
MARSPILAYADANPVTPYYETTAGTVLSLNEDDSFVLNEDDTNSEIDQ